tara:strand:+ start:2303 stop:2497 length:195 start_codon:yes stop_codon:yes gene_type:complete
MIYYFYSKYDLLKESIAQKEFSSFKEALSYFSGVKHLPVDEFLNLYEISNKSHEEKKTNPPARN